MTSAQFLKFVAFLAKDNVVFATLKEGQKMEIGELLDPKGAVLSGEPPFFSWKKFFVPEQECLFEFAGQETRESKPQSKSVVLLGLNILDLKAVLLYDLVFAADPYYQARRKNLLVIAHNIIPPPENNLSGKQYSKEALKNLPFDIFFEAQNNGLNYNLFAGSQKGKEILEKYGYKNYEFIAFEKPLREDTNPKLGIWRDKLKNKHNQKIWDELGKICLDCGKCTIACPTCFCFRIDDQAELAENTGSRNRCWDSCFYQEFSEVASGPAHNASHSDAGGKKFLENTAQHIHFWYFHKFARIPDEFGITGCIGCHRCHQVCPVGIDIKKVLEEIEKS